MNNLREERLRGPEYLAAVTNLLQRIRTAHPTEGLYQAAELQWWWGVPRPTDTVDQLFWFDTEDRAVSAAILADFSVRSSAVYEAITFCPFVLPGADARHVARVIEGGLSLANEHGYPAVELEVARSDLVMRDVLSDLGFSVKEEDVLIEAWMPSDTQPEVTPLADGYTLASRRELLDRPHHMNSRNPLFDEGRLRQTSLYRPDLDLVILDADEQYAAYGIFWHDPVSQTGVVEPMRTNDDHQRRGLARHLLTTGVIRLREAGARRISIGYEPDNPASGPLYRSVGFEPETRTDLFTGPTG